jgi:hypothetical protein
MAVAPVDPYRVLSNGLYGIHFQGGLEHGERIGAGVIGFLRLGTVRAGAPRTRAFIAQIGKRVIAMMPVAPIDLYAAGFGNRDVFRFGGAFDLQFFVHFGESGGQDSFNVSDARDAAERGDDALQLLLIADIYGDVYHGAFVASFFVRAGFEGADVARFRAEDGS